MLSTPRRLALIPVFVAAALLTLGAAGSPAAVTLGATDVSSDTSGSQGCTITYSVTCTTYNTAVGSGGQVASPFNGVVVRWRIRVDTAGGKVRLRVLSRSGGSVTGVRSGSLVSTAHGLNQYAAQLPIAIGEILAFNSEEFTSCLCVYFRNAAGAGLRTLDPSLADGETRTEFPTSPETELLFNADVERDVDCDGLGDDSQDPVVGTCPLPASPSKDTTPPTILGDPTATPNAFEVDRKGLKETAVKAAKRGTKFGFVLSESATVTFVIQRPTAGRKQGNQCRKKTRKNASRKRCTRYAKIAAFRSQGIQGENKKPFSGRIGKITLRAGRHQALITAVDAAGNTSTSKTVKFKVLKPGR